jgi:hypothetical protein
MFGSNRYIGRHVSMTCHAGMASPFAWSSRSLRSIYTDGAASAPSTDLPVCKLQHDEDTLGSTSNVVDIACVRNAASAVGSTLTSCGGRTADYRTIYLRYDLARAPRSEASPTAWFGTLDACWCFLSAFFSCTRIFMTSKGKVVHNKSRGRPAGTRYTETIPVRLEQECAAALDRWAEKNDITRSEAIRRLVELGLPIKASRSQKTGRGAAHAATSKLAGEQIDRAGDKTATDE